MTFEIKLEEREREIRTFSFSLPFFPSKLKKIENEEKKEKEEERIADTVKQKRVVYQMYQNKRKTTN